MPAPQEIQDLAQVVASAAEDKLATDIVALDVSARFPLADVFVLASAPNERQVASIVEEIEHRLRGAGAASPRREGERDGRWVLLDTGDLVVHVLHEDERLFYQLERLWKDCPPVPLRLGPVDT